MDKFKVGDVVIKVLSDGDDNCIPIGSVAVIARLDGDGIPKVSGIEEGKLAYYFIEEKSYELKHIAESPLYKALL